jgi:hypothetical protein
MDDNVNMRLGEADSGIEELRRARASKTRRKNRNKRHIQSPHLLAMLRAVSLSAGR